jgi:hypothetical protein
MTTEQGYFRHLFSWLLGAIAFGLAVVVAAIYFGEANRQAAALAFLVGFLTGYMSGIRISFAVHVKWLKLICALPQDSASGTAGVRQSVYYALAIFYVISILLVIFGDLPARMLFYVASFGVFVGVALEFLVFGIRNSREVLREESGTGL